MKKQANKVGVFLKLATVLGVVGFCSIAQAAIVVNLNVNASENKLTITTHGTCVANNSNGCIKASGNQPINFSLTGNKACSAGGNWELSSVALGNSQGQPGGISSTAASDFSANQSSGVVTPTNSNANHIGMRNNNTAAYDVWYTVYATCEGAPTINSDPRIENDGSGRN